MSKKRKKRKEYQAKLKEQSLQKITQELKADTEELLKPLEEFKDVQKMEFGYFRLITTLSTASTGLLLAFFDKLYDLPFFPGMAGLSIICFASCLVTSLFALISANNLVLLPIGIKMVFATRTADDTDEVIEKKAKDVQTGLDKIGKALKYLGRYDKITTWLFVAGIALLLFFMANNFFG